MRHDLDTLACRHSASEASPTEWRQTWQPRRHRIPSKRGGWCL